MLPYIILPVFAALVASYIYLRTQPELERKRRVLLGILRGISLSLLLILLISPIYYYRIEKREKPIIVSLLDSSTSMDLEGAQGKKSTYLNALLAQAQQAYTAQGYSLSTYKFADGLDGSPSSSLLAPSLTALAGKVDLSRVRAILLASDGWLRDEDLSIVSKLGIPIHILADTSRVQSPDLAILRTQNNRFAYRNEPTILRAEASSVNFSGDATIKLYIGDSQVGQQQVRLQAQQTATADFTHRFPTTGFFPYRMEISAAGISERSLENNSYPGAIEVLADKERIVMISDKPDWDNKFILDVIGENNRWEATHYTVRDGRLFVGEQAASTPGRENLAAIVIVNNGSLQLPEATASFIRESLGRGVGIFYQGAPIASLASLLPVQASNISASYSGFLSRLPASSAYPFASLEEGEENKIPPVDYYYVTAKSGSETLFKINNAQSSPALVISSGTGGGRVIALSFLNLWKWQLQGSKGAYKKLIHGSLSWLANRGESSFNAIYKTSYLMGEEILIRLRSDDSIRRSRLDQNPRLRIIDEEGSEVLADYMTSDSEDYILRASLNKPGSYRFEITEEASGERSSGQFSLASGSIEDRDFDYNLPLLSWIASQSGGRLLAADYMPVPAEENTRIEARDLPLYRKWYLIALFILCFSLELFFRRRWGLL